MSEQISPEYEARLRSLIERMEGACNIFDLTEADGELRKEAPTAIRILLNTVSSLRAQQETRPQKEAPLAPKKTLNMVRNLPYHVMFSEDYQARFEAVSKALGGNNVRLMGMSGGPTDGWVLGGQKDRDLKLPGTKGSRSWVEALEAVESWIRENST